MPYKVFKRDDQFCVHKLNNDGSMGTMIRGGCHAARAEAMNQMRALYAAENKDLSLKELDQLFEDSDHDVKQLTQDKDYAEPMAYIPWGVTSFAELDQAHEAQEMAGNVHDMASSFSTIVSNIMSREEVTDKAKAIESLANEFATRVRSKMSDDSDHKEIDQKYKAILEIEDPLAAYYAFYDLGYDIDDEDKLKELPDEVLAKAVWTTAYKNNLPDSSFMFISPGCGTKDSEGKTKPRSCRHFPIKDDSGKTDAIHVRNAIARIPQSNAPGLSAEKKRSLQERSRKILAGLNKEQNPGFFEAVKETVSDAFKSFLHPKKDENSFMVWKEADGQLRWFARYSNWFRDDDNPPDIFDNSMYYTVNQVAEILDLGKGMVRQRLRLENLVAARHDGYHMAYYGADLNDACINGDLNIAPREKAPNRKTSKRKRLASLFPELRAIFPDLKI